MASHAEHSDAAAVEDKVVLGESAKPIFKYAQYTAVAAAILTVLLGLILPNSMGGLRRIYFAYLTAYAFVLSIALSAMVFVLIHHVTRAAWSVVVRRQMENIACIIPTLGIMSLPILASVAFQNGSLYRWALPRSAVEETSHVAAGHDAAPAAEGEHGTVAPAKEESHEYAPKLDELTLKKRAWLNPFFFVVRIIAYFLIWTGIARWYRRQSVLQDQTGDVRYTHNMEKRSAPALVISALTVTLAAFDLIMSLDPHWYSTIFGVYYFAGGTIAFWATLIVIVMLLQRAGYVTHAINKEHFHDLGKYLFGFVFFWGYIAFSQYMLLWYANIPEETEYLARHGFTTSKADISFWSYIGLILLFCKLAIPFLGLLSRHVKRVKGPLFFWAIWLLVFHFLDIYWMVMPELNHEVGARFLPSPVDICALLTVVATAVMAFIGVSLRGKLMPTADPRLPESLAFHNI